MDHTITIGDVLSASGIAVGIIVVVGILVFLLWFFSQGWNH